MLCYFIVHYTVRDEGWRTRIEKWMVKAECGMFVASWTGVIKYHGPRPTSRRNRVWVCNHSSMIDWIVLSNYSSFATIMQKHPGWVGFFQDTVLSSLGCVWFNRTEAKDRLAVGRKIKAHVQREGATPLLIFPEGTCVNNQYCVMFKKGAFDLDATVCPIAIKYNKIFVDACWYSKQQSFTNHLLTLMTSWAVVADVWFLEPQTKLPGETSIDFANRVRDLIARRAGLKVVPWDGYLKYYRPNQKLCDARRCVASPVPHATPEGLPVHDLTLTTPPPPRSPRRAGRCSGRR